MQSIIKKIMAGATGLEPATSAVTGQLLRGVSAARSSNDSTRRTAESRCKAPGFDSSRNSFRAPARALIVLMIALLVAEAIAFSDARPPVLRGQIDPNGNDAVRR